MSAPAEGGTPPGRVFSVTALTQSIRKNLLSNNEKLAGVWIEGEVSGNKIYGSGHRYFALKDANATISCVLFAFCRRICASSDFRFRVVLILTVRVARRGFVCVRTVSRLFVCVGRLGRFGILIVGVLLIGTGVLIIVVVLSVAFVRVFSSFAAPLV